MRTTSIGRHRNISGTSSSLPPALTSTSLARAPKVTCRVHVQGGYRVLDEHSLRCWMLVLNCSILAFDIFGATYLPSQCDCSSRRHSNRSFVCTPLHESETMVRLHVAFFAARPEHTWRSTAFGASVTDGASISCWLLWSTACAGLQLPSKRQVSSGNQTYWKRK